MKSLRHHAGDREDLAIQRYRAVENGSIAAEMRLPVFERQYDDPISRAFAIVRRGKQPAQPGMQP